MLKVLLADDDYLVRSYLSTLINWNECGWKLVGAARDGQETLDMVHRFEPDLILSDVRMPVMDGLALLKELKKKKNAPQVVFLSIHDDFHYIREAMQLGAREYILKKDLNEDVLLALLDQIRREILEGTETENLLKNDMEIQEAFIPETEEVNVIPKAVAETLKLIQTCYAENLSLNDAAQKVHLNPAYLSHLFHTVTGQTFSELLLNRRIEAAKDLLLETDLKIKDISKNVGFNDYRNFCKYFKKKTGVTPQTYRKMSRHFQ